jgi:hypothetical protein
MTDILEPNGAERGIPNLIPPKQLSKYIGTTVDALKHKRSRKTGFAFEKVGKSIFYHYPLRPYDGDPKGSAVGRGKKKK